MSSGCDPCGKSSPKSYKYPTSGAGNPCGCSYPTIDATCVKYSGPSLVCIGSDSTKNLEDILLDIDARVCTTLGDYSVYNMFCINEDQDITTEQEFVEAISKFVCDLRDDFVEYTDVTNPGIVTNIYNSIGDIYSPGLTLCAYTGVIPSDNIKQVLGKLGSAICSLDARLFLSPGDINWGQCFAVPDPPENLTEAFNLLLDQICQAKNSGGGGEALPRFNNVGTCLPGPVTSSDSLFNTVEKIKSRLCQTAIYNIDSSPWGCIPNPDPNGGPNIQSAFNTVLNTVNSLVESAYTFDPNDFNINQTLPGDTCSGYTVSLKNPGGGSSDPVNISLLADTDVFNVLGSPSDETGTFNIELKYQPANTFLASPDLSSGKPVFRKVVGNDLADKTIPFDKLQNVPANTLLGRFDSGEGSVQFVSVGSGLSLTPQGTLIATATTGSNFGNSDLTFTADRHHFLNSRSLSLDSGTGFSYSDIYNGGFGFITSGSSSRFFLRSSSTSLEASLDVNSLTANRSYALPDKSGTVALLSDITGTSINFSNTNLTLTGDRSHNLDTKTLRFTNGYFTHTYTGVGGFGLDPSASRFFIRNTGNNNAFIDAELLSSNRTYQLPNKSGTIALIDDIASGSGNFANTDLTFTADRIHDLDGKSVTLNNGNQFHFVNGLTNSSFGQKGGYFYMTAAYNTNRDVTFDASGVTGNRVLSIPNKSGTIALLDDISGSSGNFASTNLSFTGNRLHDLSGYTLTLDGGAGFQYIGASGAGFGHDEATGSFVISHGSSYSGKIVPSYTNDFTYQLPAKSGTFALLDDIVPNTDTNMANTDLTFSRTMQHNVANQSIRFNNTGSFRIMGTDGEVNIAQGRIGFFNTSGSSSHFSTELLTGGAKTHRLPNKSGTFALLDDIPSGPSNIYWDNKWYDMGTLGSGTMGVSIDSWEVTHLGIPILSTAPMVSSPKYKIDLQGNLHTAGTLRIEVLLSDIEALNYVEAEYSIPLTSISTEAWDILYPAIVNCDSDVDVKTLKASTPYYSDIHSVSYVYLDRTTGSISLVGKIRLQITETLPSSISNITVPILITLDGVVMSLSGEDG